ncbi:hypothetical protein B0H17DRAFT_1196491 [Mycena rosella]|uniref:Uncharacterized protein n=1 Tax=Mycena rosella TaxID=1033263 RepID=A0AAD7GPE0_MYCRO|nr:hypothetical protein B0H17DRAFT_1196491 [Mycena rosella]
MAVADQSLAILPPDKFEPDHTYQGFISNAANWPLFRVSRGKGYGAPSSRGIFATAVAARKITSDVWLGTELVGAYDSKAALFARRAQEVLVYKAIPSDALVVTLTMEDFFGCLPGWCEGINTQIADGSLPSTEAVVRALAELARDFDNNLEEEWEKLATQSVQRGIAMLRSQILPISMGSFDEHTTHADAVHRIARLAAIFCWWPKWITGTDPLEYPALLERVEKRVLKQLKSEREDVLGRKESSGTGGVVRSPAASPHKRNPYSSTRPVKREHEY